MRVCKSPGLAERGDVAAPGLPVFGERRGCGSHLLEEFIHEAVSVHSDSDVVIIVAVLGLQGVDTQAPVVGPLGPVGPGTPSCPGSLYSRLFGWSSEAWPSLSVPLAGTRPGCALSSSPQ